MWSSIGRLSALLLTAGVSVRLHTWLPAAHCAQRISGLTGSIGPGFYSPTRADVCGRMTEDGFQLWRPGAQQSSSALLDARLAPDRGGAGTWVLGRVRPLLLWRVMMLAVFGVLLWFVGVALITWLRGTPLPYPPPAPFALSLFLLLWSRRLLRADCALRGWLASELGGRPVE